MANYEEELRIFNNKYHLENYDLTQLQGFDEKFK